MGLQEPGKEERETQVGGGAGKGGFEGLEVLGRGWDGWRWRVSQTGGRWDWNEG